MAFELTILGCGSATPTSIQNPTAQILKMAERFFLIDCGEGTQVAMRKNKIKFTKIDHIFISHLHGDHYYGLIGLLSSFHLLKRDKPLTVHCPVNLRKLLEFQMRVSNTRLHYTLHFNEIKIDKPQKIHEDSKVEVWSIPLKHSIATQGFVFKEKLAERSLLGSVADSYEIPKSLRAGIKRGLDYEMPNGEIIPNSELTTDPAPPLSYGFFSDTAYQEDYHEVAHGLDLMYHESTFVEKDRKLADKTLHSTAADAAKVAKRTSAKRLLLGHYSVRYESREVFLEEAKKRFRNSELAYDGRVINVP